MNITLIAPTAAELSSNAFLDGSQLLIPDRTELEITVTGGFVGYKKEGDAVAVAEIAVVVSQRNCKYLGQTYVWRPKVFALNERAADIAKKNLALFDCHVGSPIIKSGGQLNTETIAQYWVGKAKAIALFRTNAELLAKEGKNEPPINFISALKYLEPQTAQAASSEDEDIEKFFND